MQDIDSLLKQIIDRYSSLIRHVIASNLHKTDNVNLEDIEQEVKVKIWKFLKKGKKVDNFPSYIKRVAYTATIDELRKMRKQNPISEKIIFKNIYSMDRIKEIRNPEDTPGSLMEEKEIRESLKALIDSLGENRKQVLRLYLVGMSIEEICEFFNWDKTKVRHLLYRGIDDLKEIMKSQRGNEEPTPLDILKPEKNSHHS